MKGSEQDKDKTVNVLKKQYGSTFMVTLNTITFFTHSSLSLGKSIQLIIIIITIIIISPALHSGFLATCLFDFSLA